MILQTAIKKVHNYYLVRSLSVNKATSRASGYLQVKRSLLITNERSYRSRGIYITNALLSSARLLVLLPTDSSHFHRVKTISFSRAYYYIYCAVFCSR